MMRRIRSTVLVLLLAAASTLASAACDVAWRFTPRFAGPARYVDAEVSWRAGSTTTSDLTLTSEWGGVDALAMSIRDFRAQSDHQWVLDRADPARKTVTHLPNERITVTYRIDARPAEPDRDPITRRDAYSVIVGPEWFHFVGYAVFAVPARYGDGSRPKLCVTIEGSSADGWIISSHGARRARSVTYMLQDSTDRLRHAVYFGGQFDVRERDIRGHPVWIARRGPWRFDMDAYADMVAKVVSTQRAFWNDFEFPPLAIELLHTNQRAGSSGGTALDNAFLMYAPDDFTVPGEDFDHLLAHEHLHTWIPRRFGAMGDDEALRYWFSEGFTDFYTHRLLVQSGAWTFEHYAEVINRKIERYLQASASVYDNERVKASFFSDPAVGALPYQRGELLALRWHSKLSARSADGLDGVLRSLLLPTKVEEDARPRPPLATARLLDALDTRRLTDARADVERHIERGESMALDATSLGPCFDMRVQEMPAFRLGFDRQSVKDGKLIGVEVDGPAYAAGLREGQPIDGFGLYEGDVTQEVYVLLRDPEGKNSEVRYLPVSSARRSIPLYVPKPAAAADPACRAWFGLGKPAP